MRRLLAVMTLVTALAVACGGDDAPVSGGDGPPDATLLEGDPVVVTAIDNSFQPEAGRVAAGTEVTFVNAGRNDHNVIPEDEDAEWAVQTEDFGPGAEASYTFDEPGTYRYFCSIHGTIDAGMPGVLVVE